MNPDASLWQDAQHLRLLAACDEALAGGATPPLGAPDTPAQLRAQLEREIAWCRLVRQCWPTAGGATLPSDPMSPVLPAAVPAVSQVGRFHVLRELGRGTFGVVFLAYDPRLGREVALKVPRAEALLNPEVRARFQQEARAAAGLEHPNLVPVYEAGEEGGVCYIASAYCPGQTLAAWLRQRTEPVPYGSAAHLGAVLAEAVEHAHRRGVLHRDLKPANILLVGSPGVPPGGDRPQAGCLGYEPRITDFGLAKLLDRTAGEAAGYQTQSGAILGTPSYMAPEQAAGKSREVGPAADVYALGATLYELLTGRPPFVADTTLETLLLVNSQDPLPPARLRPQVPRDLETICLKCLRKEPSLRYASAGALAEDLRRFLAGEPIRAVPAGSVERALKWMKRRPALAGLVLALVLAVLALLGGMVGTSLGLVRARQAEKQAREDRQRAEEERAIAQAVSAFLLEDLLDQADLTKQSSPAHAPNPDITVSELLARAAATIDTKFDHQPVTKAAILRTLGNAYVALWKYDEAQPHLERALALCRQYLDPEHAQTLATQKDLVILYYYQEKYDLAEPLCRAVVEVRQKKLGPRDPDTLAVKNTLAVLAEAQGRLEEAESLYHEVLQARLEVLGPNDANTVTSQSNLGEFYLRQRRYAAAEPLLREVLDWRQEHLHAHHPHTFGSRNILAQLYQAEGQDDRAEALYLEVLRSPRQLPADDPYMLRTEGYLAHLYQAQGKYAEAERLYRRVLKSWEEQLGPAHPDALRLKSELSELYQVQGKYKDAEVLHLDVLTLQEKHLGLHHSHTLAIRDRLGALYLATQDYLAAEKVLRPCLTLREQYQPAAWTTFHTRSLLGAALAGQQKYGEAEKLLLEGYEGLKARAHSIPPQDKSPVTEAVQRLVDLYDAWGRKETADGWRCQLRSPEVAP